MSLLKRRYKKPAVPPVIFDSIKYLLEKEKLDLEVLLSVPIGAIMVDKAGIEVIWDQAMLDALAAEMAIIQGYLDGI